MLTYHSMLLHILCKPTVITWNPEESTGIVFTVERIEEAGEIILFMRKVNIPLPIKVREQILFLVAED